MLAARGHAVTVLTSRYDAHLPAREVVNSVTVVRVNVSLRLGKGPLMAALPWLGWQLARQADIVHLHLPQFDAALLSFFGRMLRKPVALTYHCDLSLPPGWLNQMAEMGSAFASYFSASLANAIVTNTADYAKHSPVLSRHLHKVTPVFPPIEIPSPKAVDTSPSSAQQRGPVIGMVGRLAAEKGAETLAAALPLVRARFPQAVVRHAGEHERVPGEDAYIQKIKTLVADLNAGSDTPAWQFMGRLSDAELLEFFDACTLTVLPSLNSTESFGMVQLESMARGAPVVASDLPGVREPVQLTGMGRIVSPGSPDELAQAILQILDQPEHYRSAAVLAQRDHMIQAARPESVAAAYETLFKSL
jgi:glycosyltransferase involved in cell wall biosynthesis